MSVLKLELKEEHFLLLSHLKCSVQNNELVLSIVDKTNDDGLEIPFTDDNKYDYIDLVLNGVPEDFDPFNVEEPKVYTDEQKSIWDKLFNELPLALSIILQTKSFEIGGYKAKFHDVVWKKK